MVICLVSHRRPASRRISPSFDQQHRETIVLEGSRNQTLEEGLIRCGTPASLTTMISFNVSSSSVLLFFERLVRPRGFPD
jgi:hypothetical protein